MKIINLINPLFTYLRSSQGQLIIVKRTHCRSNAPNLRLMATVAEPNTQNNIKYLNQNEAVDLDQELFTEYGFSVDQLMELAGLAVATAVAKSYPLDNFDKPLVCCGPGNNGGDGLVCARHLKMFGYSPTIVCPKPAKNPVYENLLTQCRKFQIEIISDQFSEELLSSKGINLMIDSVFGFSFKPPNRNKELAYLLKIMHKFSDQMPLISVDIPSGWHVEKGPTSMDDDQVGTSDYLKVPTLKPECLISLTAPKLCARHFKGRYHYLGGRFCPKSLEEKYQLNLPKYTSTEGIVLL